MCVSGVLKYSSHQIPFILNRLFPMLTIAQSPLISLSHKCQTVISYTRDGIIITQMPDSYFLNTRWRSSGVLAFAKGKLGMRLYAQGALPPNTSSQEEIKGDMGPLDTPGLADDAHGGTAAEGIKQSLSRTDLPSSRWSDNLALSQRVSP